MLLNSTVEASRARTGSSRCTVVGQRVRRSGVFLAAIDLPAK